MNIISLQDFAKLAEIETKQISVYLKRNKLIADKIIGTGKNRVVTFDIEHPINKSFLLQRSVHVGNKKQKDAERPDELQRVLDDESELKNLHRPDEKIPEPDIPEVPAPKNLNAYELDRRLKEAELGIRIQKQEVNKLLIAKAKKKLISTDIVGRSVSEVVHRYQASFVQLTDQLIRDTLNSMQADPKLLTETLSRLTDIANEVGERAIMEAKIAIENSASDSISLAK
jgi:hypothetical protein